MVARDRLGGVHLCTCVASAARYAMTSLTCAFIMAIDAVQRGGWPRMAVFRETKKFFFCKVRNHLPPLC